jgi:hypothetical protein
MKEGPSAESNVRSHSATQYITQVYASRRFIYVYITVRHLSVFRAGLVQSAASHHLSLRCVLILSSHLRLRLPRDLIPSDFPTKTLYAFLFSHIRATCPAHPIPLQFITLIMIFAEAHDPCSPSLCNMYNGSNF